MPTAVPTPDVLAAVLAPTTVVTSRIDIYEEDGETPWLLNVPAKEGTVSVDSTRDERRHLDLVLDNENDALANYPDGFWYDKIIKPYRGVQFTAVTGTPPAVLQPLGGGDPSTTYIGDAEGGLSDTAAFDSTSDGGDPTLDELGLIPTELISWETQLGEFIIDEISTANFPNLVTVKGRDYTAKLLEDPLGEATTFSAATPLETVIHALAANGGITKFILPATGVTLGKDYAFEAGTTRWEAMTKMATAFGYELFFDANGFLVMRTFRDPATSPVIASMQTGPLVGNLVTYTKVANQSKLFNAVDVTGESTNQATVFARAENNNPSSPTSIDRLKRRKVYRYKSAFIETQAQADSLAASMLAVYGLESFSINWESIVLFWLEAADIVEFLDPNPNPGDPTRFLLSDFSIPLGLGTMTSTGRRLVVVS